MNSHSSAFRLAQRLFLWIGVAALVYSGGSAAYAGIYQRLQSWKFEQPEIVQVNADDLHEGDLVGKLEIPRIGISVMVFQGTSEQTLLAGAGHVPGTPLPGANGNISIAAHRDTFFRKLEEIRTGDDIRFSTKHQTGEYIVDAVELVDPEDTRVLESRDRLELTLITCYPFHFIGAAPKRFVVHTHAVNTMTSSR